MNRLRFGTVAVVFCWAASLAVAAPRDDRAMADDIFYQFMPIAWRDSDNDPYRFGDFNGMTAALDYLQELGVTAVWMNPIFPSPAYHGYQHGPADQVNARLGTEAEFLNFVRQAHARGIKVFVDLVCYGVSHDSTYFQSAYGNPGSPYDAWLAFTNAANTTYQGYTYPTWNGDTVGFIHWDLNHAAPRALVTQWAKKWLDPDGDGDPADGIDGYRLDHVWYKYNSGPNGWGYNIDQFWLPWRDALRAVNPRVFIFAEQQNWLSYGANLLPAFDATFTKPFESSARNALTRETAASLYSSMAATLNALPPGKTFLAILGDHDVDRLASVCGGNPAKAKAAAAILLTQPFPPIIYAGDEIGMLGTKKNYGGDANDIPMREPFKWNAAAGPPMSNYWILNAPAYANRFSRDHDGRSVEEQRGVAGSLWETHRQLIALRKKHPALRQGAYQAVVNTSARVWAFTRRCPQETLLVAINVHAQAQTLELDLSAYAIPGGAAAVRDLLNGERLTDLTNANRGAYPLALPEYGYRVLSLDLRAPTQAVP